MSRCVRLTQNRRNWYRPINVNNHHIFLPSFKVCTSWSYGVFFGGGGIGWDTLNLISYYSDSVYWWTKNSREKALSTELLRIITFFLPSYRIWTSLSHRDFIFGVDIVQAMLIFICKYWWTYHGLNMGGNYQSSWGCNIIIREFVWKEILHGSKISV